MKIISEGSIGSNLRRVVALTGEKAIDHLLDTNKRITNAASLLKAKPEELGDAIEKALDKQKQLDSELKSLRAKARKTVSATLLSEAVNGFVVARVDGTEADELRELALDIRDHGANGVVLIGSPDGSKVALVAATQKGGAVNAGDLIGPAAKAVGGGGGKGADFAMAGGRDTSKIDEAIQSVKAVLPV